MAVAAEQRGERNQSAHHRGRGEGDGLPHHDLFVRCPGARVQAIKHALETLKYKGVTGTKKD